jgi:hypothetical protein
MALKEPLMVRTVTGSADLTLQAKVGESLLIKGIKVFASSAEYVTAKIEKTTVGYFRVSNTYGNHLFFPKVGTSTKNLLDLLYEKGIFTGFPVGEGETFVLSGANGSGDVKQVIYEIWDAGDKKPEDPNGSKSKEYFILNYGDTGVTIDAAGDFRYGRSLIPVEFPQFPFGADVPAKTTVELYGICGKEVGVRNSTPATAIYTQRLKMVKERIVLHDEDRNGFLFDYSNVTGSAGTYTAGGRSNIGNYDHLDDRLPLFFSEPLMFEAGEELNIYVTVAEPVDGSSIALPYQVITLIEKVRRE